MPIVSEPDLPGKKEWLWDGEFSSCGRERPVVSFLRFLLDRRPEALTLILPTSDGILRDAKEGCDLIDMKEIDKVRTKDTPYLIATLCTRSIHDERILYLPLDDFTFMYGLNYYVDSRTSGPIPWDTRIPIAYWRGGVSGGSYPTIRTRFIERFSSSKNIDAKFLRGWATPDRIGPISIDDPRMFDEPRGINIHMQHKYIFIIDGACIASALQWVFASGSVPVLVTHPENEYWFRRFLIPGVHCITVNYDLSDVEEKIQWLIDHDAEAETIARNARDFSSSVFTPDFQQKYIASEVIRILGA
jgi:Glycosyl transferase family 90